MAIHIKKVLFITTGAITIIAFAGILALRSNINAFAPRIEAAASTALGMDVRIKGKMAIALFPGLGLAMEDVTVRKNGLDVAKIEKMRIGLKFIPLAHFRIEIIQVGLIKPVFAIARSTIGMFSLEKPARMSWEEIRAVKKISISQGSLVYTDETSGETIEVGDLDLSLKNLFFSRTNSAELFKTISFSGISDARDSGCMA